MTAQGRRDGQAEHIAGTPRQQRNKNRVALPGNITIQNAQGGFRPCGPVRPLHHVNGGQNQTVQLLLSWSSAQCSQDPETVRGIGRHPDIEPLHRNASTPKVALHPTIRSVPCLSLCVA